MPGSGQTALPAARMRKAERCFCLSASAAGAKRERQKPRARPAGESPQSLAGVSTSFAEGMIIPIGTIRQGFYRKANPSTSEN